jgi:hypothetical protein
MVKWHNVKNNWGYLPLDPIFQLNSAFRVNFELISVKTG